jgi:hypothetical protein
MGVDVDRDDALDVYGPSGLVRHGAIVTTIARKVNGGATSRRIVDNHVHIEQTATSWSTVSGAW